jgi:hypothetical protein
MKRYLVMISIVLLCGSLLIGCTVAQTRINEKPSQVVSQKDGSEAVSATTQLTSKPIEPVIASSEKSKPDPVAYISIDINPSIELGVDSIDNVISAEACNEDGKKVLIACNVIGLNIKEAVKILIAEASRQGFIAADGSSIISITTETLDANKADNLKRLSENGALEAMDDCGDCAAVYKDNIEISIRDEAKKAGISVGKLMLINKLKLLDPTATIEKYKDAKISDIISQIKALSGDKYESIMNDDVDCNDSCMDDCSCSDCSDCKDDHCDADCADGCNENCVCRDCEDCGETNSDDETDDSDCTDDCKDDCSCKDCENCEIEANDDEDRVESNIENDQQDNAAEEKADQEEDAADMAMDEAEEKADQEIDSTEIND